MSFAGGVSYRALNRMQLVLALAPKKRGLPESALVPCAPLRPGGTLEDIWKVV
jgi:hypothetical protein